MNVNLDESGDSRSVLRVWENLRLIHPGNIFLVDRAEADLVVIPAYGRHDHIEIETRELKREGREYAIIQLALQSTRNPNPEDWLEIWQGAKVVWSYYALPGKFNLYHAPLGADSKVFHPLNLDRGYLVGTTGNYARAECLWEVGSAARKVGWDMLRITGLTHDEEINRAYNDCKFISGLRRKDGFELPVVEGLLAGARPIVFDTPNYRQWYEGLARFIPERTPAETVINLMNLFCDDFAPVTSLDISYARDMFNWSALIKDFWERCV